MTHDSRHPEAIEHGHPRLRAFLAENGEQAEIVAPGVPMPTVPLAAAAIRVRDEQIIKSVLFEDRAGAVVLAIACGTARIDRRRLADVAGIPGLKLAGAETVLAATGFPAGGVSPIGHANRFPVVIDRRVMEQNVVFGGAGTEDTLLRIAPSDIARLTNAVIADIAGPPPAS